MELTYGYLLATSTPEWDDNSWEIPNNSEEYPVGTLTAPYEIILPDSFKSSWDENMIMTHSLLIADLRAKQEEITHYILGNSIKSELPTYTDDQIDRMWMQYQTYYTIHYDKKLKEDILIHLEELERQVRDGRSRETHLGSGPYTDPKHKKYYGSEDEFQIRDRLQGIVDGLFNNKPTLMNVHYRRYIMKNGCSLLFKWNVETCRYTAITIWRGHTFWGIPEHFHLPPLRDFPDVILMLDTLYEE